MVRVGINGLGRIGRAFFKQAILDEEVELVAINDLGNIENLAYLLRYDTAYGRSGLYIEVDKDTSTLRVNGNDIKVLSEKDPAKIPWKDMQVDVVVESTGVFETYEKAKAHLAGGAKRVVITAPAKDETGGATVLMGVNEDALKNVEVSSNASCTTNAASPLLSILHEKLGVERALLNTVHAYTATQALVDGPDKANDFRRGRAGAANIAPSSTGAAIATTKAITDLSGNFDGIAVRVPVITGSIVDITFVAKRETTAKEVNEILTAAAREPRWNGIFAVTNEPLVSSDIIGDTHASIADLAMTRVIGTLVKVLGWYDNEAGYAHMLLRHVKLAAAATK